MRSRSKRWASLLLAVVICLSCVQLPALAIDDEGTSDAPNEYLEDISIVRGRTDDTPIWEYNTETEEIQSFCFDVEQTEYNIVLPEVATIPLAMSYAAPALTAKLSEEASSSSLVGAWSTTTTPTSTLDLKGRTAYANGNLTIQGTTIYQQFTTALQLDGSPVTLYYLTGDITNSGTDVNYTSLDIYTFHFYRMAALSAYPTVTDGEGTSFSLENITGNPNLVNPYITDFQITVPEGTAQLKVTAKAVTPASTSVQCADGKDSSVTGESDVYTLTLADYGDDYKQDDGSLQIPFTLHYTGGGSGIDGHYTLTVKFIASEETSDAPNGYVDNLSIVRGKSSESIWAYDPESNELKPFQFQTNQTEYSVALPETANAIVATQYGPTPTATLADIEGDTELYGAWSETKTPTTTVDFNTTGKAYQDGKWTTTAVTFNKILSDLTLDAAGPVTRYFLTGDITNSGTDVNYTSLDIYTFHFYRMAALSAYPTVTDGEGTSFSLENITGNPNLVNPYITDFQITVPKDTAQLKVTAKAVTPASTSVQFADGKGSYITGEGDTYTLTLADYGEGYKQDDGSLQIPFTLDYTGGGSGIDGHYTLTVQFEGPELATPVITAASTATVSVEDLANWKPTYSATGIDGGNATEQVSLSYYQSDGTTSLADMNAVVSYIDDASENKAFIVELSLNGAESVRITVTVEGTAQPPVGEEKLIDNIRLYDTSTTEETVLLDLFDADDTESGYACVVPCSAGDAFTMPLTLTQAARENASDLRLDVTLRNKDGETVRSSLKGKFSAAGNYVTDLWNDKTFIDGNFIKAFFADLEPGVYTYTVKVYSPENQAICDERTIQMTFVPYLDSLQVFSDARQLNTDPDISYRFDSTARPIARHTRDYAVTVPGNTTDLQIKGTIIAWKYFGDLGTVYYQGQDVTVNFLGDGFTVDLNGHMKDNGQYEIPFSVVYGDANSQVRSDYTLTVTMGEASNWAITTQPTGGTYDKGAAVTLSVGVMGTDAEKVSYQWQWDENGLSDHTFTDIEGATESTFTPPTEVGGKRVYRCVVTERDIQQKSNAATVVVNLGQVNDPQIVIQPGTYSDLDKTNDTTSYQTTYTEGEPIQPVQVAAGSTEATGLSDSAVEVKFAWYYNDENSYDGAVLIDEGNYTTGSNRRFSDYVDNVGNHVYGIISSCKIAEKLDVGTHYYFCEVYVYEKDNPKNRSETIRSNILAITVQPRSELEGFTGTGTESDPYLIEDVEDLQRIKELVEGGDALAGAVFQLKNDITLPADWDPIGVNNGGSGKNLLPFSGILDGGGHTMTIPDGGKPLLNYARDAVVRNLKIYGENIDGSALLNNVCVDYGTDGIYQQMTDPDIITVENVTLLSGSKTSASGLVKGGYSSGINDVIIRNCTIEKGVVIGCDKGESDIGSFVGAFNGRIEDSVSYATVYGVRDVGGLAGSKGQSMGDCIITNSAFLGEIVATGGHVGGILGAGYVDSTAPQVPPVSVQNCYVAADITANSTPYSVGDQEIGSGIGGIVGSEFGAIMPKNSAYICDNHFYGTITDTSTTNGYERVGGIIGELGYYDAKWMSYENNYYLENSQYQGLGYLRIANAEWEPEAVFVPKTATEFADGTVLELLNQGSLKNWVQRAEGEGADSPYPIHSDVSYVREITLSGDYKTEYYIGDPLDLSGMVITAHWSDGTTTALSTDDVEISGYDNTQRNISLVTIRYGTVDAEFTVTVLQKPQEDEKITVYFTLLGDEDHTDTDEGGPTHGERPGGLDTWIPRTSYTVDVNTTLEDIFTMALDAAGIEFKGNRDNPYNSIYISGIQSPVTGDWIEEFTNGPNSGWMYTVNGTHPDVGLSQWFLSNGENIIFHYTDDYTKEEGSEHWGGGTTPAEEDNSPVLAPEVKADKDGNAEVSISGQDINDAIASAKEDGATSIIIAPQISGDADSLSVTLPKGSVGDILNDTDAGVSIESELGHVELPQDALTAISDDTNDASLTIYISLIEREEAASVLEGQIGVTEDSLKNCAAVEVKLISGSTEIRSFGGRSITLRLPVDGNAFETGRSYVVYHISGSDIEKLAGKCVSVGGNKFVEVTVTHLSTFVVLPTETMPFTDVTEENWFYEAVQYVYDNNLMNGVSSTLFDPNGTMTRAMLVTILYRLEDEPAVTAANAFTDVPADSWYTDAVIWADAHGIVEGVGSQQFAPADNITREQMAVMLYRYAQYKGYDLKIGADLSQYTDAADISSWALDAMEWANAEGLITGRTATTIVPDGTATRAEAATILMRFLQGVASDK